ncbi:alpha/beta hydrolase family esterase [Stagnimonas aquatica]|nr:PHB depolymerase family esterase [Stagnimonas aquatica]
MNHLRRSLQLLVLALTSTLAPPLASASSTSPGAPPETATSASAEATPKPASSERNYALYVPPKLEAANQPSPLVVVLHGSNQRGADLVAAWCDLANEQGFLVLGPDSLEPRKWNLQDDGPGFINTVIDAVRAQHPVDSRRIYLFGYSAGGLYALTLGLVESEYFAGIASYAALWKQESDQAALQLLRRKKLPVKLIIGEADALYTREAQRSMEQALRKQRVAVSSTVIEGQGHSYADVSSEINRLAWAYLKDQKLPDEPVYIDYGLDDQSSAAPPAQ